MTNSDKNKQTTLSHNLPAIHPNCSLFGEHLILVVLTQCQWKLVLLICRVATYNCIISDYSVTNRNIELICGDLWLLTWTAVTTENMELHMDTLLKEESEDGMFHPRIGIIFAKCLITMVLITVLCFSINRISSGNKLRFFLLEFILMPQVT